jgi:hypothetical protein
VPGSYPFPFIFILTVHPCSQPEGLSIVKFTGLQLSRVQSGIGVPLWKRAKYPTFCQVAHRTQLHNNANLCYHMTCCVGTCIYHLTYRLSPRLGFYIPAISALCLHIHQKTLTHWFIRVVKYLGMVNEVPDSPSPPTALTNLQTSTHFSQELWVVKQTC